MSLVSWRETLDGSVAVADGPTLTTIGAASCLPTANIITLPTNFFKIGKKLRIEAHGRISTAITTPGTVRFDVRLGGTVVWDSGAIALETSATHTNMPWWLEIDLTCRAQGSGTSANLMGSGKWFSETVAGAIASPPKGVLCAMLPWNTAPVVGSGFNSTAALSLDLFFTQTVSTGSLTLHQYSAISCN